MREKPKKIAIGYLPIVYAWTVTALLCALFLLIFLGITEKLDLVITTGSLTETFADKAFSCHEYELQGLKEGHRAEVTFLESRKYVGSTENGVSVTVYDQKGQDITYKYQLHYKLGTLQVEPATYQIQTGSKTAGYSGQPISNRECQISGLLPGHRAEVLDQATLEKVGSIPNIPILLITDRDGKDITDQYVPVPDYGTLALEPRSITVSSADVTQNMDGTAFTPTQYTLEQGTLAEGDTLVVKFSGSYSEIGSYVNHFDLYILRETGGQTIDVTHNYIVEKEYGTIRIE